MASLFEPVQIGPWQLANRIVMAPLTRDRAPRAVPTPLMATYYAQRAGAGLIVSEGTAISAQAQGYADVPGLYAPEQIDGWKAVTAAVHAAGGKIVVQLWHVGRVSHTSLQPGGAAPVAPSAIRAQTKTYILHADGSGEFVDVSMPRALAVDELPGILDDYRRATAAALEAGFDGVEIHSANGYLLDEFLRADSNHRTDAYGGSVENRARFPLEVVAAVTEVAGPERAGIRISPVTPACGASDPHPQPIFDYYARRLAEFPLAYVHVIEGATGGPRDYQQGDTPFDYRQLKAAYRAAGGRGAWMVNNGYDRTLAEAAVAGGYADLVAFGRPFIANPDLVRRLETNAPLNPLREDKLYGGGAEGYTDYPALG